MFAFAALVGILLYLLGCLKGKDMDGELMEDIQEKKEKVKSAFENIKEDAKDMKDSAESIFESGDHA